MSSLLEERYRRALRLLPAAYRQAWEEDMVATFLQTAHAANPDDPEMVEIGSPSRSELVSIAALAVRLRLGGVDAAPRSYAWGEAVRRVALVTLLVQTAGVLTGLGLVTWIAHRLPGPSVPAGNPVDPLVDMWQAVSRLAGLLWLLAFLSIVYGHRRAARIFALVALIPALVSIPIDLINDRPSPLLSQPYWLAFDLVPLLALTAFHHGAPPVKPRPWLVALGVGTALSFALVLLTLRLDQWPLLDEPALWSMALCGAATYYLAAGALGRPRALHVPLTMALLALGTLLMRVLTLVDILTYPNPIPGRSAFLTLGLVEAIAVLAVGVTFAVSANRTLRSLPGNPPGLSGE